MSLRSHRLEKGDWVLLTGANSYIGSNIMDILLDLGLNVRGTIRTPKPWLNELFDHRHGKGRFETVIIPSMENQTALQSAMSDVSGVVHVAAAVSFNPNPEEVIPVVVEGTLSVLKAAAELSSVKSVVLTSSSTAALIAEPNKHVVVDENTWNDAVVKAAWDPHTPKEAMPFICYGASKTESERKAWEWYRENKPRYVFNTILPNFNTGTILSPEIPGSTMGWVRNILDGDDFAVKFVTPQYFVDVRDDARLHVAALLDPSIQSERIFAFAEPFNLTDILIILRKLRPENTRIPKNPENEGKDVTDIKPRVRALQVLKDFFGVTGWTSLEDSMAAGIANYGR